MELDWSTFVLEIVNFLVLVWILTRFLYKPVLKVIGERKASIDKALTASEQVRAEAEALRQQYESRLGDWEREKERARSQLIEELTAERARSMAALRIQLDQERERARVVEERRAREVIQRAEETAITQGGQFAARLLSRLTGPELEAKIIDLFLADLQKLPDDRLQAIQTNVSGEEALLKVTSAFPLTPPQREALLGMLKKLTGQEVVCEFLDDKSLLAGVRISVGPWLLCADLQGELGFFAEAARRGN
ncbi:MAG: ATPase [Nitrospirae bacterium]|nr:MAG: ATPase [Nitrospirota bacterium]